MINLRSLKSLAKILRCPRTGVERICTNIDDFYRTWEISKSNGKTRLIEAPRIELKSIQKRISRLLLRFPLAETAYGSVKGKSNKDNAFAHRNATFLFMSDIRSFYPSVHHTRVYSIFKDILGCSPSVSRVLTRLSTYKGHLPTGAPTSPYLANILMTDFDGRLEILGDRYGLVYTRYMDDINFSGKAIPEHFQNSFFETMAQTGLLIHKGKTGVRSKGDAQVITGIGINQGRLKVPKSYKARIRAIQYAVKKGYLDGHKAKQSIEGMKSYVAYVES